LRGREGKERKKGWERYVREFKRNGRKIRKRRSSRKRNYKRNSLKIF